MKTVALLAVLFLCSTSLYAQEMGAPGTNGHHQQRQQESTRRSVGQVEEDSGWSLNHEGQFSF